MTRHRATPPPTAEPTAPVLWFQDVQRTYPATPPVAALRGVDLRVERGEYVAVTGASGSGKSTLLNLAGLLDHPTSGTLLIDGVDTVRLGEADRAALRAHRIGIVFQSFHLMPYRTALENAALAQLYRGVDTHDRINAASAALRQVGLTGRAHALPTTLSGGEQQRVAIARALVNTPSLLLADEPTGNLDSAMSADILDILDALHADGYTVVIITHDQLVADRSQRIVHITDGELAERQPGQPYE